MVYITENIIAMGFLGNDSGPDILGFKEVVFLETFSNISLMKGKGKCKIAGLGLVDLCAIFAGVRILGKLILYGWWSSFSRVITEIT